MFKPLAVIVIILSFCCFLCGIFNVFVEVEDNACRMTYMFGEPQFSRVDFAENKEFPYYGLYYYYEGRVKKNVNRLHLKGAPVIFVPGNGGSYKQARSLASVALRKGLDSENNIRLDYFTINYNEELSGLYGGYLENQKDFLKLCIRAVLKLYSTSTQSSARQVVIIGHSMGGKVAQAVLTHDDVARFVNTVIFVSSPLDRPVVNFDTKVNAFYEATNQYLAENRHSYIADNETNVCTQCQKAPADSGLVSSTWSRNDSDVTNVLLISIGGGNRDLLVRSALTTSIFSDINAVSSSIPKVWLSCDHLSSVWCLQLVLVVNRFLFSIAVDTGHNAIVFNADRALRLHAATNFFVKPRSRTKVQDIEFAPKQLEHENIWHEESKRVFRKRFRNGIRLSYNQMINLGKYANFKKLFVEVVDANGNDWIYGCAGSMSPKGTYICEKVHSLSHYVQNIPSLDKARSVAILNLHNLRQTYTNWTHVVVRLDPTNKQVQLSVDIHNPAERNFNIKVPRWYDVMRKYIINETVQGTQYYKIFMEDLIEPFRGIRFNIEPIACLGKSYHVTTKICVPWAHGFHRYKMLTDYTTNNDVYLTVPMAPPLGYNATKNPVSLEVYLDAACRYSISYEVSIPDTTSRIVREFFNWIPAHLTAVLMTVLKNQISKIHTQPTASSVKPYGSFFQFSSIFMISGCRVLKKLLLPMKFLPAVDDSYESISVSVIVHSVAIVLSILLALAAWALLVLQGNFIFKFASRLMKLPIDSSAAFVSVFSTLPIAFGVVAIGVALRSCSGIALLLTSVFYFMMLSNAYKDFLENWLWEKGTTFLKKAASELTVKDDDAGEQSLLLGCDANEPSPAADANEDLPQAQELENDETTAAEAAEFCEGLQNFSYHVSLFMLVFMLTVLNGPASMAWLRSFGDEQFLPDTCLMPTVVVLICLSLLWQLNAPSRLIGYRATWAILHIWGLACIIYCQESIYRLNFMIAIVFVVLLVHELISRIFCYFTKIK